MANKGGRPSIEINKDNFESLCNLQCTKLEIAGFFHCSEDTIENYCHKTYGECFSAVYKKYSQGGKISLRREQWKLAQKGNCSMLIWLGRQWLGQTDKVALDKDDVETFEYLATLFDARRERIKKKDADN
jgi:hypothetical protein